MGLTNYIAKKVLNREEERVVDGYCVVNNRGILAALGYGSMLPSSTVGALAGVHTVSELGIDSDWGLTAGIISGMGVALFGTIYSMVGMYEVLHEKVNNERKQRSKGRTEFLRPHVREYLARNPGSTTGEVTKGLREIVAEAGFFDPYDVDLKNLDERVQDVFRWGGRGEFRSGKRKRGGWTHYLTRSALKANAMECRL